MRKFKLNKLVRDKIVDYHLQVGEADYKVLSDQEYLEALRQKLIEEAKEMNPSNKKELLRELADVQEVMDCLLAALHETHESLAEQQKQKNQKSGSFKKRHFISTVSLPEDNQWAQYYAADPERFPEVKS